MNQLIDLYRECLHLQQATFVCIEHEDAMVAKVYKIILPTGRERILKICERENDFLRSIGQTSHSHCFPNGENSESGLFVLRVSKLKLGNMIG